jgi:hypothetical protein
MDIQLLAVIIIFCASLFYLGRKLFLRSAGKQTSGCEKCGLPQTPSAKKPAS